MWWWTTNWSPLLIYWPWEEDERLSWPGWLTYSGRLTHISGHPSATGRAQDSERTLARDWRSTAEPRRPTLLLQHAFNWDNCLWMIASVCGLTLHISDTSCSVKLTAVVLTTKNQSREIQKKSKPETTQPGHTCVGRHNTYWRAPWKKTGNAWQ